MPTTPYDLVQDDQDLRVPVHAEQAFFHGITFQAKFVGWEEVPRPNTRAEIVQAMRRIRYECKVQNLKKRKVTIHISVNGVRVVLKKRRRKKKNWTNDPEEIELLNHPIYRIFYVSHDSSDLKIFSYIARDPSTDTFKCSVFKSHKKSQAMRIVRTVGQAFEVCHKFNLHKNSLEPNDERSDVSSELLDVEQISEHQLSDDGGAGETPKKEHMTIMPDLNHKQPQRPNHLELLPQPGLRKSPSLLRDVEDKSPSTPSSPRTEVSQLKDQLEAQATQTRQALAQLMLVREQLISETNARIEAQARTQQLLQQNRELLEHLASLGAYNEQQSAGLTSANIGMAPQLQLLLQASSNNNNLASINQQINNLGNINQQLTSLSQQLSGLNQQSQNLQNLQQQQQTPTMSQTHQTPSTPPSLATPTGLLQLNVSSNAAHTTNTLSSSPYPSMNQLQSISNQLQQLNSQQQQQQQQDTLSKDLFQVNQELLNRLQTLNLSNSAQPMSTSTSQNSFFYVNPLSCSPATPALSSSNAPSSFNFLTSPVAHIPGNLAHSPLGTLNRNSYTGSTSLNDDIRLSIEQNLNNLEEQLKAAVSNGNLAGMACGSSSTRDTSRSSSTLDSPSSPRLPSSNNNISAGSSQSNNNTQNNNNAHSSQEARFMLRVTDEAGNITNQRKLSATPSFITRSTSEKVPNRSQMMSQVQRTAWARHTTK